MERFEVIKGDIGKTVVFCSICDHKRVFGSVAVAAICPKCKGLLQFLNITKEFFDDEE